MAASVKDLEGLPDWPALMSQQQAAAYTSRSVETFLRQVDKGIMPPPVPKVSTRIPVWSKAAIDEQIASLSGLRRPMSGRDELIERAKNGKYTLPT